MVNLRLLTAAKNWRCFPNFVTVSRVTFYHSNQYMSSSAAQQYTLNTKLGISGKSLILDINGKESVYHSIWLRHNCQCPSCMAFSGQKTIDFSEITSSIILKSAQLSDFRLDIDGQLNLSWSSGHSGYIDMDWLQSRNNVSQRNRDCSTPTTAYELPMICGAGLTQDRDKLWRWLHLLNEYGVCLLTNMGDTAGSINELANTMYNAQGTIYGETFDVEAQEDFVNIAYSNQHITFHMDLIYYESAPGLQLLHCLKFDECVEGGESVMLDMFPVVEELRKKWPEHFNTLTRVPATFQKVHYERQKPVDIILQCPHIQLDRFGEVALMSWSPPFEGTLDVPNEDIVPYYEAYHCLAEMLNNSKLKLSHRLRPGEIMTFNNRRVLHSRKHFVLNGGKRHLQGVYVNIDHFKSKFKSLCNELGKTECKIRRVFSRYEF